MRGPVGPMGPSGAHQRPPTNPGPQWTAAHQNINISCRATPKSQPMNLAELNSIPWLSKSQTEPYDPWLPTRLTQHL